jgi:hypothetical protein
MHDYATLSEHGRYEIEDLLAAGITPTPAEIVELSALGWGVMTPEARAGLARGVPIQAGQSWLWPLTQEAWEWYGRIGVHCGVPRLALAWAMAHCYNAETPFDRTGKAGAAVKALTWAARLKCTSDALTEAVSQVLEQDEEPDLPPSPESPRVAASELSAQIAARCGGNPDYWNRQCSRRYAYDVLRCVMAQANESGKPLPNDPVIIATQALGWAVEKIKQRHAAEQAAPNGG